MLNAVGIGTDIENISRFASIKGRDDRFLRSFLTPGEIDYCFSKESPLPHIASRFAAKEAVIKALSGLSVHDASFKDIEITNDRHGAPSVKLKGRSDLRVEVSLSHCEDKAVAIALAAPRCPTKPGAKKKAARGNRR